MEKINYDERLKNSFRLNYRDRLDIILEKKAEYLLKRKDLEILKYPLSKLILK
ncbi:MAG: hypothetical protein WC002_00155 [Candidatus Muiribacteriota bacterium]|jgi:hypothetical protein